MSLTRTAYINSLADELEDWAAKYREIDFDPSDFYVGIAKDSEGRAQWHKTEVYAYIEIDSREIAGDVEKEMTRRGFNTGSRPDNGGDEESVVVYIYPITPNTRETS